MKDEKDEFYEKRMQMWKRRDELLNSMSEKELRAFIKGYMMAERTVFRHLSSMDRCYGGSCNEGSSCRCESCNCADNGRNCSKE